MLDVYRGLGILIRTTLTSTLVTDFAMIAVLIVFVVQRLKLTHILIHFALGVPLRRIVLIGKPEGGKEIIADDLNAPALDELVLSLSLALKASCKRTSYARSCKPDGIILIYSTEPEFISPAAISR
jgi:hypothetical protein